jgi:hypothetical protein
VLEERWGQKVPDLGLEGREGLPAQLVLSRRDDHCSSTRCTQLAKTHLDKAEKAHRGGIPQMVRISPRLVDRVVFFSYGHSTFNVLLVCLNRESMLTFILVQAFIDIQTSDSLASHQMIKMTFTSLRQIKIIFN